MGKIEELIEKIDSEMFAFPKMEPGLEGEATEDFKDGYNQASKVIVGYLKELPTQQDKVVVPEFVAEYVERYKKADSGLIWSIRPDRDANDNSAEVYDWLFPNGAVLPNGEYPEPFEPDNLVRPDKNNQILFARAWLDGYTVEKTPKWIVEGDRGYLTGISISRGSAIGWSGNTDKSVAIKFTDRKKAKAAAYLSDGKIVPMEEEK